MSATSSVSTSGVVVTRTERARARSRSTASVPMPLIAMISSAGSASTTALLAPNAAAGYDGAHARADFGEQGGGIARLEQPMHKIGRVQPGLRIARQRLDHEDVGFHASSCGFAFRIGLRKVAFGTPACANVG